MKMKSFITYAKLKNSNESRGGGEGGGRRREVKDDLSILMGIQRKGSMIAKDKVGNNNKSSSFPITISSIPKQQHKSAQLPNRRGLIFNRESSIKISQPAVRQAPGPAASSSHAPDEDVEMNSLRITSPPLPSHNYDFERTPFNGFEEGKVPDKSFLDRIQPPPPMLCDETQVIKPVNLINNNPIKRRGSGLRDRGEVLIQTPWISRRTKLANLPNPDVTSRYAIKDLLEMMCGEMQIDDNIFTKTNHPKPKPTYNNNNPASSTTTRTVQNMGTASASASATARINNQVTLLPHGQFDEIFDDKDLFQLNDDGDQNEMDVDDQVDENQNLLKPYTLF